MSWVLESYFETYLILMFEILDFGKEMDPWAQKTEIKTSAMCPIRNLVKTPNPKDKSNLNLIH